MGKSKNKQGAAVIEGTFECLDGSRSWGGNLLTLLLNLGVREGAAEFMGEPGSERGETLCV